MNIQKSKKPHNNLKSLLILLLLVSAIPITVSLVLIQTRYFSRAALNEAQYLFVPLNGVMPPDQQVELLLNTGTQHVGFVRTVLSFDPSKMQLSSEIIPSTALTTVNKKTSMAEANTTGTIEMVFSMWPGDATPSGLLNIAKMPFRSVSSSPNDTTSLVVQVTESEIVDLSSNTLTPSSDPLVFTLNPTQIQPSSTEQHIVNMNITAPATVADQQEFTAQVVVNTNSLLLTGADFVIQYNPNLLELIQADTAVFSQKQDEDINNVTGIYRVSLGSDVSSAPVSGVALQPLSLSFKAISPGNTTIGISQETAVTGTNNQQILVSPQGATLSISSVSTTAQGTNTPTCTPRPACTIGNNGGPICLIVEPPNGWCPIVVDPNPTVSIQPRASITPSPTALPVVDTPTPTPTIPENIIPNAPFWFELLPPNVKGFLEQIYLTVFVFGRQTNLLRLLDGIISD